MNIADCNRPKIIEPDILDKDLRVRLKEGAVILVTRDSEGSREDTQVYGRMIWDGEDFVFFPDRIGVIV